MCVNDRLGLLNSQMIARYIALAPVLKPLIFAIKAWARPRGYNDPSGRAGKITFSSYTLTLMTIALFQVSPVPFTSIYLPPACWSTEYTITA
jgi:DNA polymerase sigma